MSARITRHFCAIVVLTSSLLAARAFAITEVLDYQGYLTTATGAPVNGSQTIRVALYAQATGGTALWMQTNNLAVADGRFSMLLDGRPTGSNPFPSNLFDQTLWAGIKVGADAEMTPRTLLAAAPYSFKSADAETLGGFTAAQLAATTASYMGASTSNIGGAAGHLAMNAACNSTFPGSRMCTSEEILSQDGPLTITKAQHVHPVIVTSLGTTEVIDYSGNKATWGQMLCGNASNRAWASTGASATGLGIVPATSNRLTLIDCGDQNTAAVACCKDE